MADIGLYAHAEPLSYSTVAMKGAVPPRRRVISAHMDVEQDRVRTLSGTESKVGVSNLGQGKRPLTRRRIPKKDTKPQKEHPERNVGGSGICICRGNLQNEVWIIMRYF